MTRCERCASYAAITLEAYVFVSERGGPISSIGFHRLVQRLGEAAKMPFPIHPHMLCHATCLLDRRRKPMRAPQCLEAAVRAAKEAATTPVTLPAPKAS